MGKDAREPTDAAGGSGASDGRAGGGAAAWYESDNASRRSGSDAGKSYSYSYSARSGGSKSAGGGAAAAPASASARSVGEYSDYYYDEGRYCYGVDYQNYFDDDCRHYHNYRGYYHDCYYYGCDGDDHY